ncbi:hypothetical protein C7974DRAFT_52425 [Boeremia exigua]|uniref:uncharacterized protein n=1 Tax=Boeremia exigua TaxID=749465 RepID=UPI001E8EC71E|nr:uncharacterized protein C7974DRAFT_52425 [Boeremia exigua]KAH6616784.1 hypothetical protein C7974DRAFT_52425 [Boeremia exigua]
MSKIVVFIAPQLRRLTSWVSIVHEQTFRYLAFDTDQQKCILFVSRNAKDEYEIQDSQSVQMSGFPVVSATSDGAENRIVSTLAHIAAYKFFEKIENRCPDPVFENLFRLKFCDSNGSDLTQASRIDIRHEGILSLVLENFDQVPRYQKLLERRAGLEGSNTFDTCPDSLPTCRTYPGRMERSLLLL